MELGRLEEAINVYRDVAFHLLNDDAMWGYWTGFGRALWERGNQTEASDCFRKGCRALRDARRVAGIDETSLEFVRTRQVVFRDLMIRMLEGKSEELAFEAAQVLKAGVLGDLRDRHNEYVGQERPEIDMARTALCVALRGRLGEAEVSRRAQQFTKLWHSAQPVRLQGQDHEHRPPTIDEIASGLPEDWAIVDFWVLNADRVAAFLLASNGSLEVVTLSVPRTSKEVQQERNL